MNRQRKCSAGLAFGYAALPIGEKRRLQTSELQGLPFAPHIELTTLAYALFAGCGFRNPLDYSGLE